MEIIKYKFVTVKLNSIFIYLLTYTFIVEPHTSLLFYIIKHVCLYSNALLL